MAPVEEEIIVVEHIVSLLCKDVPVEQLVKFLGPISAPRKDAFLEITRSAGFPDRNVAFVTAYLDRGRPAFKKTVLELAWNSFAWFASEPDHIVVFREGAADETAGLAELLRMRKPVSRPVAFLRFH